jgi:hypothetical protein
MSWTRVSLLTKVTRDPAGIVTVRGDTPLAVIVIVEVPGVGFGVGEGEGDGVGEAGVELLPPHPRAITTNVVATQKEEATSQIRLRAADRSTIRRTSLKY